MLWQTMPIELSWDDSCKNKDLKSRYRLCILGTARYQIRRTFYYLNNSGCGSEVLGWAFAGIDKALHQCVALCQSSMSIAFI